MEAHAVDDDSNSLPLADGETNSTSESQTNETSDETSNACDTKDSKHDNTRIKLKYILDKSISIDDDSLIAPLRPVKCNPNGYGGTEDATPEKAPSDEPVLKSILRRPSTQDENREINNADGENYVSTRRVSFPEDESTLADYREPEIPCPWLISKLLTPEEIVANYQHSCKKNNTIELDVLKNQFLDIKNNTNRSATLNLSSVNISTEVCETLEDLFKIVNFRVIIIKDCKFTAENMQEIFNMFEYYETVRELEICEQLNDVDTWRTFCNYVGKSMFLESITFKNIPLSELYTRMLMNGVKSNSNITILKFDGCRLVKLPSFSVVEHLMTNSTISELYLPKTGLYTKEADALGRFIAKNLYLKVLDISNNYIGDRGVEALAKGLIKQTIDGNGLSVLLIFNNQLTEKCGPTISSIIEHCQNLHTLNIGYNNLTDEVILCIQNSLSMTKSLEGFGLQSTLLTCKGADYLAEAIQKNKSLQKINLKGNKAIRLDGLEKLCVALTNSKVTKLEIDETNRSCNDPQAYVEVVKKINGICAINKAMAEHSPDEEIANISRLISRKVSLSCEPYYFQPQHATELSPVHSSMKSPPPASSSSSPSTRSRFTVLKVADSNQKPQPSSPIPGCSRFKVSRVTTPASESVPSPPPEEEEEEERHFINVRSSMSSTESIDSFNKDEENSGPSEASD